MHETTNFPHTGIHVEVHNLTFFFSLCTEARGLVRSLIQPDPTVRLTAEQTLLHQWVKAMTSVCRQRALSDKTQSKAATTIAELQVVQKPAETNAAESQTDKAAQHVDSKGEISLSRHDEHEARGKYENKPSLQQPEEASTASVISQQDKENKPLDNTCDQEKHESTPAGIATSNK